MSSRAERAHAVHVLNPGGRDAERSFDAGPGTPADPGHPPVNFHAYAACTGGTFFRDASRVPPGSAVIVLLRPRHLDAAIRDVHRLKKSKCKVALSIKEAGAAQISENFSRPERWAKLQLIAQQVDFYIAPTRAAAILLRGAGCPEGIVMPPPYPLDFPAWDFSMPLTQRKGIFVGTREFRVCHRHHLLALAALAADGHAATVLHCGKRWERKLIERISGAFRIVGGPLPYPDYLHLMGAHRVVFQLDGGMVPGQVAGDALLCRMPCVGGSGEVERVALCANDLAGGTDWPGLCGQLKKLLQEDEQWVDVVGRSQSAAANELSFSAGGAKLRDIFKI